MTGAQPSSVEAQSSTAPRRDRTEDFNLFVHPNLEYRAPLTVICLLVPLSLLAELYRWMSESTQVELFTEPHWHMIGQNLGVIGALVPAILLTIGGLIAHTLGRYRWELPRPSLVVALCMWGALWALVRYVTSFTTHVVFDQQVGVRDHLDTLSVLGQAGLAMSGAIQEELIFRAGLLGLMLLVLRYCGAAMWWTYLLALPASAALFSLAHTDIINHYAVADALTTEVFMHRFIAGLVYGLVFIRQGLAVCTFAHFGFNFAVMTAWLPW